MRSQIKQELRQVIQSVKRYLEAQKLAGIEEFYLASGPTLSCATPTLSKRQPLDKINQEVIHCKLCPLYKTRKNPVFGQGNPKAKLVFVGEAPGKEEDLQGVPFIGEAGQLLTRIIQSMQLKREDVYICNVLKCRPPENRNPLPSEVIACQDYLWRQLELIQPRVIVCLGKFASLALLNEDTPITKIRGKFQDVRGIKVMPTFHPAYLLRNPDAKKLVWEDVQKVMLELKGR